MLFNKGFSAISSTIIRNNLENRISIDSLVSKPVEKVIRYHNLYSKSKSVSEGRVAKN